MKDDRNNTPQQQTHNNYLRNEDEIIHNTHRNYNTVACSQYVYINEGRSQQQHNNIYHIYDADIINHTYINGISDAGVQCIYTNDGGVQRQIADMKMK